MKTIYLARHAKSSWNMGMTRDFDRPLNKRGETDAIKMAKELQRLSWLPEKIISSPAQRAKQTCLAYCDILEYPVNEIEWNPDIYEAYTVTLLQILSNLEESTNSIMLIGHNPAMEDLLLQLCGDAQARKWKQKDGKFLTTGNIVNISFEGVWKEVTMGSVFLEQLIRPKTI